MIKRLALATAAITLLAAPAVQAHDEAMREGEVKLAKLVEGRTAGEPERCIRTFGGGKLKILDGTAIVYERGDTVWVNRTENPHQLDDDDMLVIRKFSASQLCRLDNVSTQDRYAGFYTGHVFLSDFVPYTKEG